MIGRWWFAAPKYGATQQFRTPYAAMLALDLARTEGDLYTQHGDGSRAYLGHRTEQGEWQ
jgi:hypothetical protein